MLSDALAAMGRGLGLAVIAFAASLPARAQDPGPFHVLGGAVVDPRLEWEFPLDGDPGRVHVDGARVYVESGSSLFAFDIAAGKALWRARDVIHTSLPRHEGNHPDAARVRTVHLPPGEFVLVPGREPGSVAAIDRETGRVRWRHETPDRRFDTLRSRFCVRDGRAYVVSRNLVEVLRLSDGKLLASHAFQGDENCCSAPALAGDVLCMGDRGLRTDGRTAWKLEQPNGLVAEPVVANGLAYLTTNHGQNALFAVEPASGRVRFRFAPARDDVPMGILPAPLVDGRHLLATYFDEEGGATSTLYGLDPRTGAVRWRTPLPAVVSRRGALFGDTAYFYTWDKEILVVSCTDGAIAGRFKPDLEDGEKSKVGMFTQVKGGQDVAGLVALEGALVALVGREYPHDASNQLSGGREELGGGFARLRVYRCGRTGSKAARALLRGDPRPSEVVALLRHVDRAVSREAAAWLARRYGDDLGFRAAKTDAEKHAIHGRWMRRVAGGG